MKHEKRPSRTATRPQVRKSGAPSPKEEMPMGRITDLGKSLLITLGIGILLTLIASLIAYFSPDPNALIRPLGICAAALTALFGGFAAVRIHGHEALLCGILNGSVFMGLMILVSLFFKAEASGYAAWLSCLLHAGFVLLSIAGAYLGLKRKTRKR